MKIHHLLAKSAVVLLLAVCVAGAPRSVQANATVTIVNFDGPGEGFNDPTLAAPVGGNIGTTVGQQRLLAFQFAADLWGATLDSNVEIFVGANFDPLTCTATGAVLGSAGTTFIFANFTPIPPYPGPLAPNLWHGSALSDKRAGFDLNPGFADIGARFNSNLNGNPACLGGTGWYLGFDNNHGSNIDLVTVVLHELGHGMGFQQFASTSSGALPSPGGGAPGLPDVYNRNLLDVTSGKTWDIMTNAERVASAINTGKLVWQGSTVTSAVPTVLLPGTPLLVISSPASVAGNYNVGSAAFGPPLSSPGVTAELVLTDDGVAPTSNGCEPTVNSVAGKIAVVDRGVCTFVSKAANAQAAGAVGLIVINNVAGSPAPGLGGVDPSITIPVASLTLPDGNAIKAALAGGPVFGTLGVDLSVLAGADAAGRAIMNTPNPLQPGSSVSHWDPIAFPNQLMEPAINADLTHSVQPPQDLTLPLMRDIGWFPDADVDGTADDVDCEPNSNFETTVTLLGCNSGIPNVLLAGGCTISDLIDHIVEGCADADHGCLVSGITHQTKALVLNGTITAAQRKALQQCAAHADFGSGHAQRPDETLGAPAEFGIQLAGANPSRDGARVQLAMPTRGAVALRIVDLQGALVWSIDRDFEPGVHTVSWNGQDRSGRQAAPGVYFVQVATAEKSSKLRFVLLQ